MQELSISREDVIYQKFCRLGNMHFKFIVADAKIYPCIIIYVYNKPYQILQKFLVHYKDLADFLPLSDNDGTLDKNPETLIPHGQLDPSSQEKILKNIMIDSINPVELFDFLSTRVVWVAKENQFELQGNFIFFQIYI